MRYRPCVLCEIEHLRETGHGPDSRCTLRRCTLSTEVAFRFLFNATSPSWVALQSRFMHPLEWLAPSKLTSQQIGRKSEASHRSVRPRTIVFFLPPVVRLRRSLGRA